MAEAAVSYVAERLFDFLQRKIVFLKNVQQEVEGVRSELVRMKCFLRDADMKQEGEEENEAATIRNWVSEIRRVAFQAEDVIEIFIYQVEYQERKSFFLKLALYPKKLKRLYKVRKQMESIQSRVLEISSSRERYGIRADQGLSVGEGSREKMRELRRSSPLVANKQVVGLEKNVKAVMGILLKEDKRLRIASIVGMGGIGKTTLAKEVYNQQQISDKFDIRAWVYVSQDYKPIKIVKELILQLASPDEDKVKLVDTMEKLSEAGGLEGMLHKRLENQCYLIVLDDIWDKEAWDLLSRSFPDNDRSSRLLLTTRIKDVPLHADAHSVPYELKLLDDKESWELFLNKVFVSEDRKASCPEDLVDVGKEIVRKCAGLPLAISVVGGLLAAKREKKSEWERVLTNLSSHLSRSPSPTHSVSKILALSYHDLPPTLKSCFLHLGLLRKDKYILAQQVVHIWIAHGLIHRRGAERLEDIAEGYLDELISRNMVQVATFRADERVRSCRLHDLLRDFCIVKGKDEILLEVHEKADDLSLSSSESRHHVFYCPAERYVASHSNVSIIRSLLSFGGSDNYSLDWICTSSFKLLKVLYIDTSGLDLISDSIAELKALKYFGVGWNTRISRLPHSLSKLKFLETIDIPMSISYCVQVPNILCMLENLRHLYGYYSNSHLPLKIDSLYNLQTLGNIPVSHWVQNKNVDRLTNLRKVGLLIDELDINEVYDSLAKLENLHSLCLEVKGSNMSISLVGVCKLNQLSKLKLKGRLISTPWSSPGDFPPKLSQLTLVQSRMKQDALLVLEKLSKLAVLKLIQAWEKTELSISGNAFLGLKFLRLDGLTRMAEIMLGEGSMPGLKYLQIFRCNELMVLPEELKSLSFLEKLEFRGMPQSDVARLQRFNLHKIRHIPNIVGAPPIPEGTNRLLARIINRRSSRTGETQDIPEPQELQCVQEQLLAPLSAHTRHRWLLKAAQHHQEEV